MDSQPLVSLMVPCYNVEKKCINLLESLLIQDFTNVQIVFVDDGSTDKTREVLFSYKEKLEKKGYKFEYYYKENGGQASAINIALKHVIGNYLCWIDSDDYYEKNAFSVRVEYMEKHPECSVLSCESYDRDSKTLNIVGLASLHYPHTYELRQFEHMLCYRSMFYIGCHMFRMSSFLAVVPDREIYDSRRGQNWQLLLPMYYAYDRYFLDVPIFNCVHYQDSHSSINKNTYIDRMTIISMDEEVLLETLKRMIMTEEEREKYIEVVRIQMIQLRMYAAMSYKKKNDFIKYYKMLKQKKKLVFKDKLRLVKVLFNL